MPVKILLFSAGVVAFSYAPFLPPIGWILLLLPCLCMSIFWSPLRYFCALGAGLVWGIVAGHGLADEQLPEHLVGRDLLVTGQVSGLPERDEQRLRFTLRVQAVTTASGDAIAPEHFPNTLQLSWYSPRAYSAKVSNATPAALPALHIGDHWQLTVRLRRPRGFVNPSGFDYHAWLLRKSIGATGYVIAGQGNRPLVQQAAQFYWQDWINQRRYYLQQWVVQHTVSSERGILVALLIGDSALVEKAQWQRMQQTGTSHLIAISGLHVGFLALFGFYFGLLIGKCVQLFWHVCPAPIIAWLCAVACAGFYAALAGFNIPTLRTFIMLSVFYAACLIRRNVRISDIFCWALVLVVILDPLAAYDMGFWLSFGAVALLLMYFSGRLIPRQAVIPWAGFSASDIFRGFVRSQWVMFIGLILPLSLLVSTVSLVAPLANAIAIPLITFFVVPLLLLGAAVGDLWLDMSQYLLAIAAKAMELLALFLDGLLALAGSWASPIVAFSPMLLLLLTLSVLVIVLPRGLLPRPLGVAGAVLVASLSFLFKPPATEDLKITLLDVGQGTAIVVQAGNHTLVYDTGPQYTRSFDAGSAIVAPYLFAQGIRRIDYLVVSHWDMDHAGGLNGLLDKMAAKQLSISQLLIGESVRTANPNLPIARNCHDFPPWKWQAIEFRFLAVPMQARNNANNHSCVLLISYGAEQIVLPGDIETRIEHQLLNQLHGQFALVVAAHHGSRTSSGQAWVQQTRPRYVVYSAGYRNQHGHPHAQVQARYHTAGSEGINTAESGAVIFRWRNGQLLSVTRQRQQARRYWYE